MKASVYLAFEDIKHRLDLIEAVLQRLADQADDRAMANELASVVGKKTIELSDATPEAGAVIQPLKG